MEKIINNTGFQHLVEKVFLNLKHQELEICAVINQSSKQILDNPMFWLKKYVSKGMSKKNETDWATTIKSAKKSNKKKHILLYLKWKLKMQDEVDLPMYTNSVVQKKFKQQISKATAHGHSEIVRILAPLTKSIKSSKKFGRILIHSAVNEGQTEIVKILVPLTDNPNAPDEDGWTPIHLAAENGHTEIVKILVSLTDNPNAPNENGTTPIFKAAFKGYTEIVKILAPLSDNPNAPNNNAWKYSKFCRQKFRNSKIS